MRLEYPCPLKGYLIWPQRFRTLARPKLSKSASPHGTYLRETQVEASFMQRAGRTLAATARTGCNILGYESARVVEVFRP